MPNPNETESNGNKNMRGALFFLAAFLLIAGLMLYSNNRKAQSEELSYPKLIELIKNGKIKSEEAMPLELVVTEGSNTQELHGFYNKEITIDPKNPQEVISQFRTRIFVPYNGEELQNVLKESKLTPTIKMDSNPLGTFLIHFLPLILFLVILYFIFSSQSKMAV